MTNLETAALVSVTDVNEGSRVAMRRTCCGNPDVLSLPEEKPGHVRQVECGAQPIKGSFCQLDVDVAEMASKGSLALPRRQATSISIKTRPVKPKMRVHSKCVASYNGTLAVCVLNRTFRLYQYRG